MQHSPFRRASNIGPLEGQFKPPLEVVVGDCFEMQKNEFSKYVHDYYDNSKTYHDGKWMFIDVNTLEQLEEVKKLILIKKKPNRKPFSKENALYSKCGQRCDLCVHYIHTSEELRIIAL